MHGGAVTMLSIDNESGTNWSIVQTDASWRSTYGRKNSQTSSRASVRSMWQRQIHLVSGRLTLESPMKLEQRGGLRVVDDDVVPLAVEQQRVLEHLLEVDLLHVGVPRHVRALQRVVHRLGDREELVAAVDDLPLGVDPEALQQRDVGGRGARRRRRRTRWR